MAVAKRTPKTASRSSVPPRSSGMPSTSGVTGVRKSCSSRAAGQSRGAGGSRRGSPTCRALAIGQPSASSQKTASARRKMTAAARVGTKASSRCQACVTRRPRAPRHVTPHRGRRGELASGPRSSSAIAARGRRRGRRVRGRDQTERGVLGRVGGRLGQRCPLERDRFLATAAPLAEAERAQRVAESRVERERGRPRACGRAPRPRRRAGRRTFASCPARYAICLLHVAGDAPSRRSAPARRTG